MSRLPANSGERWTRNTGLPVGLFWRRFSWRHARREWVQTALLLGILALGVGTFLSIRLANRAAVEGFQLFTDSLRPPSDWIIDQPGSDLPVAALPAIREALGTLPAGLYPVIELSAQPLLESASPTPPRPARLLGLDLLQFRQAAIPDNLSGMEGFWEVIRDPQHLFLSPALAEEWNLVEGETIDLVVKGQPLRFTLRGLLPEFRGKTPLPKNLAVADLSALLDRLPEPRISRVEVLIPEGPLREAWVVEAGRRLAGVGESIPAPASQMPPWRVRAPEEQQAAGEEMTAAFRLNLTVLSLIALLIGMYLIAQTLDATVSRRRTEIATLRSLGFSPRDIYRLWLSEAVLYGLAAGGLGLLAGYGMALFTVEAVTTTVRALYRDTVETGLSLTAWDFALSFALGLGSSLAAAWFPARDAASTPPAQFLRLGRRIPPFPLFQYPAIGLAALTLGAVLLFLPPWTTESGSQIPVAGYATAFLWLAGGTLVAVGSLRWTGLLMQACARNSAALRLAASRLKQPTSRHQLALSGFFVAIGMAAAMAFLINSFEHTVTRWLEHRLQADLFISSVGFQGAESDARIPGPLLDEIEALPETRALDRFRALEVPWNGQTLTLGGIRFDLLGNDQELLWIQPPEKGQSLVSEGPMAAFANESLARRTGLGRGDTLTLETPAGPRTLRIAGVHAEYSRDRGMLLVDLRQLEDWYGISSYDTASLFLKPGVSPAVLQARLEERYPGLSIRLNGELMEAALFIFRQTFAVTRALQVIGLVVALGGLALSLLSLLRESGRELSLQRTLGMRRNEIANAAALEGGGVAAAGLACGIALSAGLGLVLVYVINRQSFGWTLQVAFPWASTAGLAAAVLALGLGISWLTGRLYLRRWRREIL